MRPVLYVVTIISLLTLLFSGQLPSSAAAGDNPLFVYLSRGKESSQFRWRRLGDTTEQASAVEGVIDAPVISGTYIAFSSSIKGVGILDLRNAQQTYLDVKLDYDVFLLYDEQEACCRSLTWSPDSRYLGFTGRTGDHRTDVFIYDMQTGTLVNLTKEILSTFNDFGSWSPDGHWLSLGAQIGNTTEPLIASPDGKIITRLALGQNACRLIWSPDNRHLASTTQCFQPLGADSNLEILTFDPAHPDKRSDPVRIVSAKYGHLISHHYGTPRWYDIKTIIVERVLSPPSATDFSFKELDALILYDITTQHERLAAIPVNINTRISAITLGSWVFWSTGNAASEHYAYHVARRQLINLTGLYQCVMYYLSDDGRFAAIPSGCNPNVPDTHRVVTLPSRREVLSIKANPGEYLDPVGFVTYS